MAIVEVVERLGPLAPGLVLHLTQKTIAQEVPQRVFSALLGAELRSGRLDSLLCVSDSGKTFRLVIATTGKPQFAEQLTACLSLVPSTGSLNISTIRDLLYPNSDKGNWTKAYYLAARLTRVGIVTFNDRFAIVRAENAYDAIRHIDDPIYTFDLSRLD